MNIDQACYSTAGMCVMTCAVEHSHHAFRSCLASVLERPAPAVFRARADAKEMSASGPCGSADRNRY